MVVIVVGSPPTISLSGSVKIEITKMSTDIELVEERLDAVRAEKEHLLDRLNYLEYEERRLTFALEVVQKYIKSIEPPKN